MSIGTPTQFAAALRSYENRAEPDPTDADVIRECIQLAEHYIGRAERALPDIDAACDLLASAMKELAEVATVESTT